MNKKKYILTFVLSIVLISSMIYAKSGETEENEVLEESIGAITSSRPWSAAGSTGVLDEGDNPFDRIWTTMPVRYDRQRVYVRSDLPSTRYPVTGMLYYDLLPETGLNTGVGSTKLKVRYRDTGANDQVIVRIMEMNMNTGTLNTKLAFNSNNFAASSSPQTREISICSTFDFTNNVYHVETLLTKNSATGTETPSILGMQIERTAC